MLLVGRNRDLPAAILIDDARRRVCLVIRMHNGRERTIGDVWVTTRRDGTPTRMDRAADQLNAMLRHRSTGEEPRDERSR
jgi:hypothetical protein